VKLFNFYASPNIIRAIKVWKITWARHVARMGDMKNIYKIVVRNPEGKRPLGRTRHRWEDNIPLDIREIAWEGVEWMHLFRNGNQ
jgi:hypothetical protein